MVTQTSHGKCDDRNKEAVRLRDVTFSFLLGLKIIIIISKIGSNKNLMFEYQKVSERDI